MPRLHPEQLFVELRLLRVPLLIGLELLVVLLKMPLAN
jgi:hypothetical protein